MPANIEVSGAIAINGHTAHDIKENDMLAEVVAGCFARISQVLHQFLLPNFSGHSYGLPSVKFGALLLLLFYKREPGAESWTGGTDAWIAQVGLIRGQVGLNCRLMGHTAWNIQYAYMSTA